MHEAADTKCPADVDDVGCSADIDPMIVIRIAPNAGFAGGMHDRIAAVGRRGQRRQVSDVSANDGQRAVAQMRRRRALKGDDPMARFDELSANGAAEKTAASGDQDLQCATLRQGSVACRPSTLHFLCGPFSQLFPADLGIVTDVHRKTRVEQHGADALRDGVSLGQLQQVEMDALAVDR